MHLTESELAALTHGDASAPSEAAAMHLAACPECSARLEALRAADREVAVMLRAIDHPAPRVRSAALIRDLERRRRRRIGAIAAGLVFCAAGAAAALPNSPLHHILVRVLSGKEGSVAPNAAARPGNDIPKAGAGVAFIPGSSVDVVFNNHRSGGRVRIRLVDGSRVSATADGDAAFSIHQSRLDVDAHGGGMNFELEIPRTVPEISVRAGNETIFAKRAGVVSDSRSADSTGAYTFELSGAAPRPLPGVR